MHDEEKWRKFDLIVPILGGVVLLLPIVWVLIQMNSGPPIYRTFVQRDPNYFVKLSQDCDKLLANLTIYKVTEQDFRGDDPSLPSTLKDIHAGSIEVTSNRVFVEVGLGRAGFAIIWGQVDQNPIMWKLSAVAENFETPLLTTNRQALSTNRNAQMK
jgi:hypothetical protein